jgi:HK97 family phage major capsid protein
MNIDALERDLAKAKDEAVALLKRTMVAADAEGNRLFTDDEHAAINGKKAECVALQAKIARASADAGMLAEIERITSTAQPRQAGAPNGRRALSWGEQFYAGDAGAFIRAGGHKSASNWRTPSQELAWPTGYGGVPIVRGATLTEDPASGGALVVPQYLPGIVSPIPPQVLVSELFAQGTTNSNAVNYMREKTWINAAAAVLEGGLKPDSTLTFEAASDAVRKIAHWLPVTEELLEDEPAARSYIDARLRAGVLVEEQDQLINGDGTAPNISGILDRAGLSPDMPRNGAAVPPQTNADVLLAQTMAVFANSLLMPDGYVLHPSNWVATLMAKTSTGEYFNGGPFSPIQQPTLWGLPVAVTPVIAAGTGLVGAFKTGAQIFRKGGVRVEASNSHADFFIKNLVAIRAEERLALAVYRPAAFGTVSALA